MRIDRRFVRSAVLAVSCVALSGAATPAPTACRRVSVASVDRFQSDSGNAFTLRIPPGFKRLKTRSAVADVGEWRRGRDEIRYEYGRQSDWLLADDELPMVERCPVTIDGRRAEIMIGQVLPTGTGTFVGVHFPDVGDATSGRKSLTIVGLATNTVAWGELLGSYYSVRITPER